MVAPTRTPEARGVKCELCQEILKKTTWLDQKTPAKSIDVAKNVLDLFSRHDKTKCPCIPKNIENLLIGSTHFEIHRLLCISLDLQIHKKHSDHIHQHQLDDAHQTNTNNINDCQEASQNISKFKIYTQVYDQKNCDRTKKLIWHLKRAVDYWNSAMIDQTSPFNSKLALRLGLTHHVIYTCYLFKYHKLLDYQLRTSNLLLNTFKSIEGVTENARIHAYYLLIKTLIDCNQLKLARSYLDKAKKLPNHKDEAHYESILLACVECELCLIEGDNNNESYEMLEKLVGLASIKENDKLQHYHARTLALSVVIRYIHCYKARSEFCFEFYHVFRYVCAIIRRCYESSFELVFKDLASRSSGGSSSKSESRRNSNSTQANNTDNQILIHSWIRFAACDFVFSAFDLLTDFFIRAGHPEHLEILFNGLNLISYRTSSCYWQARMSSLGCDLDITCDKLTQAKLKLESMSRIIDYTNDDLLMVLLRLDFDVSSIALMSGQDLVFNEIKQRLTFHQKAICNKIYKLELYDWESRNFHKLKATSDNDQNTQSSTNQLLRSLMLKACYLHIHSTLSKSESSISPKSLAGDNDKKVSHNLKLQLTYIDNFLSNCRNLEYQDHHKLLEILLQFSGIQQADSIVLEAIEQSSLFNKKVRDNNDDDLYNSLISQFEKLTTGSSDTLEALRNIEKFSAEDIVTYYLKNSEPNPHYMHYRRAHDLMFSYRLKDKKANHSLILYHFYESQTANTLRYRWMMTEEQQSCPYVSSGSNPPQVLSKTNNAIKLLPFNERSLNSNKLIKLLTRNTPENFRLIQIKTIVDIASKTEHYVIVSFDINAKLPLYFHAHRGITSGDFIEDKRANDEGKLHQSTMPYNFIKLIQDAKKTLFIGNSRLRNEKRQRYESDLSLMLHDMETDLLDNNELRSILCDTTHQIGLILDQDIEHIPFESLPCLRSIDQSIFRVPSVRIFCLMISRATDAQYLTDNIREVDCDNLVYLLDPANNLPKTRERFDFKLKTQRQWTGCIGQAPKVDQLEQWLSSRQVYLFIGHGAGMTYYNKLSNNRGLNSVANIKSMAIVMGCSSGRVQSQGPKLESFGVNWLFIMKGSPSYLGLLWDVTDTDIDRFLDCYLAHWLPESINWVPSMQIDKELVNGKRKIMTSSEAVAKARHSCQLKYLVGSTPIVYGLPLSPSTFK